MYSVDAGTKATQRGGSPAAKIAKLLLLEMVRGVGAQAKPKKSTRGRFAPPGLSGVGFG
jgi:hypothetical protein